MTGRALLCSLLILFACLPASAATVGANAPAFELAGRNAPVTLTAYRGKFVYVDFWASWCGPCKRSFPWMNTLQQRFGAAGLQVVAINLDAQRADADAFLRETPAGFTVAFDPEGATAKSYAIKGMPSSVLVDPQGRIVYTHVGFSGDAPAEIERQLEQALRKSQP